MCAVKYIEYSYMYAIKNIFVCYLKYIVLIYIYRERENN